MCAYLLMGLAGLPVFTGGTAGPGKLFGPTGGYIFGFLVAALIISWLRGNNYGFKRCAFLGVVIGIPVIYLLGVAQLKFITGIGWEEAVVTGALPFIPMDVVKCIAAAYITAPHSKSDWRRALMDKVCLIGGLRSYIGLTGRRVQACAGRAFGRSGAESGNGKI